MYKAEEQKTRSSVLIEQTYLSRRRFILAVAAPSYKWKQTQKQSSKHIHIQMKDFDVKVIEQNKNIFD